MNERMNESELSWDFCGILDRVVSGQSNDVKK